MKKLAPKALTPLEIITGAPHFINYPELVESIKPLALNTIISSGLFAGTSPLHILVRANLPLFRKHPRLLNLITPETFNHIDMQVSPFSDADQYIHTSVFGYLILKEEGCKILLENPDLIEMASNATINQVIKSSAQSISLLSLACTRMCASEVLLEYPNLVEKIAPATWNGLETTGMSLAFRMFYYDFPKKLGESFVEKYPEVLACITPDTLNSIITLNNIPKSYKLTPFESINLIKDLSALFILTLLYCHQKLTLADLTFSLQNISPIALYKEIEQDDFQGYSLLYLLLSFSGTRRVLLNTPHLRNMLSKETIAWIENCKNKPTKSKAWLGNAELISQNLVKIKTEIAALQHRELPIITNSTVAVAIQPELTPTEEIVGLIKTRLMREQTHCEIEHQIRGKHIVTKVSLIDQHLYLGRFQSLFKPYLTTNSHIAKGGIMTLTLEEKQTKWLTLFKDKKFSKALEMQQSPAASTSAVITVPVSGESIRKIKINLSPEAQFQWKNALHAAFCFAQELTSKIEWHETKQSFILSFAKQPTYTLSARPFQGRHRDIETIVFPQDDFVKQFLHRIIHWFNQQSGYVHAELIASESYFDFIITPYIATPFNANHLHEMLSERFLGKQACATAAAPAIAPTHLQQTMEENISTYTQPTPELVLNLLNEITQQRVSHIFDVETSHNRFKFYFNYAGLKKFHGIDSALFFNLLNEVIQQQLPHMTSLYVDKKIILTFHLRNFSMEAIKASLPTLQNNFNGTYQQQLAAARQSEEICLSLFSDPNNKKAESPAIINQFYSLFAAPKTPADCLRETIQQMSLGIK